MSNINQTFIDFSVIFNAIAKTMIFLIQIVLSLIVTLKLKSVISYLCVIFAKKLKPIRKNCALFN